MKHRFIFALLAGLLFLSSCERVAIRSTNSQTIDFSFEATSASFYNEDSTKGTNEYVVKFKWKEGDKISVINLTTKKVLGGSLSATSTDYNTSFTGSLSGSITAGDELMFIYPCQGNDGEVGFSSISIDFSSQNGASSNGVQTASYAKGTASSEGTSMTISSSNTTFSFISSYLYVAMSDLPSSKSLSSISISGIPTELKVGWDYTNDKITLESIINVDEEDGIQIGCIELNGSMTVSANGNRPVYFTVPEVTGDTGFQRKVEVVTSEGESYIGYLSSSTAYPASSNKRLMLSSFEKAADLDPVDNLVITANYPAFIGNDTGKSKWEIGDEVTVVNLSTDEILHGTLKASESGNTDVKFKPVINEENVEGIHSVKGVNPGDELLLIYPALENEPEGTYNRFSTNSISYSLSEQIGDSFANAPQVMTATTIVTKYSETHSAEFEYVTSTVGVTLSNFGEYYVDPTTISKAPRMRAAGNEGFIDEKGEWDETESLNIAVDKIVVENVSKLVFKYDATKGYVITTVPNRANTITLTKNYTITNQNPTLTVYFSIPVANSGFAFNPIIDVYENASEFYWAEIDEFNITPGTYVTKSAEISGTGDEPVEG